MKLPRKNLSLWVAIIAAIFFLPFLGGVHLFDWDEINFAECAREMLVSGDYLTVTIGFEAFWEKPPLFFWLQAFAMKLWGVGEYAARFPNAICGIITLVLLFRIGQKLYDTRFGLLWAGAYIGSILPHLYFKSGIIDPVFNLFIFLSLYHLILFHWKKNNFQNIALKRHHYYYLAFAGIFAGLAMLTKGQAAFVIICLTLFVYWIYQRFHFFINILEFLGFTIIALLVTSLWFGLETINNGTWFLETFITYQYRLFSTPDAGHGGFFGYHFVVLLLGCFPASIFAIRGFWPTNENADYQLDFKRWMMMIFWVVLILFSIVQSKIVHYSSMCYFPLTFLAALTIQQLFKQQISLNKYMQFGLLSIASIIGLACIALPFLGMNIDLLKPFLEKDPFAVASLAAEVHWSALHILPGIVLLVGGFLGVFWLKQQKIQQGIIAIFGGTALFVMIGLICYIGRIESYSQAAVIEFYETLADKDCYIDTYGFKSYAPLFYAKEKANGHQMRHNVGWLLKNPDVDKPAYLVAKIHKAKDFEKYKKWQEIGRKNGFVFYFRPLQ